MSLKSETFISFKCLILSKEFSLFVFQKEVLTSIRISELKRKKRKEEKKEIWKIKRHWKKQQSHTADSGSFWNLNSVSNEEMWIF